MPSTLACHVNALGGSPTSWSNKCRYVTPTWDAVMFCSLGAGLSPPQVFLGCLWWIFVVGSVGRVPGDAVLGP